jgi:hypothetical protein
MDPVTVLGVASGTSQLIQQGIFIIAFLSDLVSKLADAPQKLRQQTGQIKQLLELFNLFLQTHSIQKDSITGLLVACLQDAASLERRLLKLATRNGDSRAVRWKKSLQIVAAGKKVNHMFDELERDKTLLILSIQQVDR